MHENDNDIWAHMPELEITHSFKYQGTSRGFATRGALAPSPVVKFPVPPCHPCIIGTFLGKHERQASASLNAPLPKVAAIKSGVGLEPPE